MVATSAYDREIQGFLRDTYRVDHFKVVHLGSGHRRLEFSYAGGPRVITLHDSKQRQQGGALIAMKKQDIKKLLGEPPPQPEKASRELDQMLSQEAFNPLPLSTTELVNKVVSELLPEPTLPADPVPTAREIDRAYLKELIDEINRVTGESEWRLMRAEGRWRWYLMVE